MKNTYSSAFHGLREHDDCLPLFSSHSPSPSSLSSPPSSPPSLKTIHKTLHTHLSHSTQSTPSYFCRPNCYKTVIAIILIFLLMQYTANFVTYRSKYNFSHHTLIPSWSSNMNMASPFGGNINTFSSSSTPNINNNTSIKSNMFSVDDSNSYGRTRVLTNISNSSSSISTISSISSSPQLCPLVPPKLVGGVKVLTSSPPMDELEAKFPEIEPGGRFHPQECQARHKVAIIIPYRDREEHLRLFLLNIHPILERQQLDYGIYIVEEVGKGKFNRAKLMNIGFKEALKQYDYQCFIFHDVDLLPEDDRNLYTCPEQPRHMSVAIDKFNYRLPYKDLFGGVSALTREQFEKVNGFSNEFWGWGGEDDDMSNRIRFYHYKISRYPATIARYKMLKHKGDTPNPDRYKKLYSGKRRYKTDGISNLKYKRVDLVFKKLYTWVLVDVS